MAFVLRVAWRNLWRQRRRTMITSTAMAVAVALCMSMIALADGTYAKMFDVLVGQTLGHVQLHNPEYPGRRLMHDTIADADTAMDAVDAQPQVKAATGRMFTYGLVASGDNSAGGQLVGIDPAREHAVSGLADKVRTGRMISRQGPDEAIVGALLAETLKIAVGDELIVIGQAADGSIANELFTVVGTFRTGSAALDRGGVFVNLPTLQTMLALEGQIHELITIAHDPDDSAALAATLAADPAAADLLVRPWFEADPQIAEMMKMQDFGAFLMLAIVFAVASLGVLNTMLMAVFERTRELGVLRALGLTPARLMALVITEAVLLACVAGLIGGVLGGALDWWLVTQGIDFSANGQGLQYQGVEFDPIIKGVVRPISVVATLASLLVVSVLAAIWPAARAASLKPVTAMRQD